MHTHKYNFDTYKIRHHGIHIFGRLMFLHILQGFIFADGKILIVLKLLFGYFFISDILLV